jgi:hypothetical protein
LIAETAGGREVKARAIYAIGRHDAMGFSPFGIDRMVGSEPDLAGYDLLSQLAPLILEHQGKGEMSGVLLSATDPPQKIKVGNYTLEVAPTRPRGMPGAQPPQQPLPSAALFIAAGPDEFYALGNGVTVTFTPNTPGPPLAGLAHVEEGTFVAGRWVPGRWLAGDDTEQGQYLDFRNMGILHFTLYRYR